MRAWLPALAILGLPLAAAAILAARLAWKRRVRDRHLRGLADRLREGAELLEAGDGRASFRRKGRVFHLAVRIDPLFSRSFGLRLSTFTGSVLEFEMREGAIRSDGPEEAAAHAAAVREILAPVFPARWGSFSKLHCELVLSANRTADVLPGDFEALAAAAAVPAWRSSAGAAWTFREGWEPRVAPWHWKPEQRVRLPEGVRRWCVSCWRDNAYLSRPLVRLFERLAWPSKLLWITAETDFRFLEKGFGIPPAVSGRTAELPRAEMAVAADQFLDGDFFCGAAASDDPGAVRERFRDVLKLGVLDAAVDLLPRLRFFVRRLYDDEFSWFSEEYEILSSALAGEEVRRAVDETAAEFGGTVGTLDRPFIFKLLKEDRLEVGY